MAGGKYKNTKVTAFDGMVFDSKREYLRYCDLRMLERAGVISELSRQVYFVLAPSVVIAGRKKPELRYIADFTYLEDGRRVVEDAKGALTDVYKIKRHLMKSIHGIDILET